VRGGSTHGKYTHSGRDQVSAPSDHHHGADAHDGLVARYPLKLIEFTDRYFAGPLRDGDSQMAGMFSQGLTRRDGFDGYYGGSANDDVLVGGDGGDIQIGGTGRDWLVGGIASEPTNAHITRSHIALSDVSKEGASVLRNCPADEAARQDRFITDDIFDRVLAEFASDRPTIHRHARVERAWRHRRPLPYSRDRSDSQGSALQGPLETSELRW
jgi:hypothetical protein